MLKEHGGTLNQMKEKFEEEKEKRVSILMGFIKFRY